MSKFLRCAAGAVIAALTCGCRVLTNATEIQGTLRDGVDIVLDYGLFFFEQATRLGL